MANDISISVSVANNSATGLAAVNTSLQGLKDKAKEAGDKLTTLATKATAAAVALEALKVAADGAHDSLRDLHGRVNLTSGALADMRSHLDGTNTGLRSLNVRAGTADGRLSALTDRTRTLHTEMATLHSSVTSTSSALSGLRGSLGSVSSSADRSGGALDELKKVAISLAPALVPIAAQALPIAAGLGAAGVAAAAFGAALIPQLSTLKDIGDAQKKAGDAAGKYGAASKQAVEAQAAAAGALNVLPAATRQAATGFLVLKDSYKQWSNGLAGDTMPVLNKSFATFGALLPKLSPLVKDTGTQLDRLVTVAAGGVNSSGFDALMDKFETFTNRTLKEGTDELIHFSRVLSEGRADGPLSKFMEYARANAPLVKDTLKNLSEAVLKLLNAASEAGPGLLTLVNAFAKLVAALPTSLVATLLQVYTAFKLIKLAGAGIGTIGGGISGLATRIGALRTAAAGAGGGIAGLRAAFLTLGTAAKASVIVAGVAAIALIMTKLASVGRQAPPDIDKLTTSLGKLGLTGKTSGEAARVLGDNLTGLYDAVRSVSDPAGIDKVQQSLVKIFSLGMADSTPVKEAQANLNGIDDALANLVKNGHADQAAAALDRLKAAYAKSGHDSSQLVAGLDSYQSALDDLKFEQDLSAQSMGLFGAQAIEVKAKLDAQKTSADGLRQSIQALNETHRSAYDAETKFEAAIDNVTKSLKDNGATLDAGTEKGRANRDALSQLASATDDLAAKKRDEGGSWEQVNSIYDRGRKKIIDAAEAMGYSTTKAKKLADQILGTPDKTARLKGNIDDLQAKLDRAKSQLKNVPDSRRAKLLADIRDLESKIAKAKAELRGLNGQKAVVGVYTTEYYTKVQKGTAGSSFGPYASGYKRSASGGPVSGPGTGTSDSIPAMLSDGEFVVNAAATRRNRPLLDAINDGKVAAYARGGLVKTDAGKQARAEAASMLSISYFGQRAGYKDNTLQRDLGHADSLGDLVGALGKWRSLIKAATSGGLESRLLKSLNSTASTLIKSEKALTKVNTALDKAKDKLASLKDAAAQLSSSVSSGIVSGANITGMASQGGLVTVGGIKSGLAGQAGEAKEFAAALAALKKKGLNSQSLSEIAQAGLSGGGLDTARTLLGASSGDIKQINSLEAALKKSAADAGKITADSFYGAGIKAADGLVKGLQKQQDKLEATMARAAAAFAKQLKKSLGVGGKAAGGIIGAASGGARGGWTLVGEQGPELARLPYGSMVYPAGATRQMLGGGGAQVVQVNLDLDGKTLARLLIDPLSGEIRRINGGDVQGVLGKGKVRL
jgi:predicted  nucleic acid-binding Zn-ribbon protein